MPDITATHPPHDALEAFALGKLDPNEASVLEEHLPGCDLCMERADSVAPDTLVQLLAAAQTRVDGARSAAQTPTLDGSATPSFAPTHAWDGRALEAAVDSGVPAALAGHPKYRVVRCLGIGGMGTVWLAQHEVMHRPVAIKLIRPDLLARPGATARFLREVRAAAKLQHPNIVTAFDAESVGDSCLLVMEYVPGETLADRLKNGPLSVAEACRAIRDAARGLAHAHAAGLVHRDVKPHNLIRADDGTVKVLDFGLAGVGAGELIAADGEGLTGAGMVVGTPDYIAPEQIADPHAADARADIYGLGCTFYHLLAGCSPVAQGSIVEKLKAQESRTPDPIPGLADELAGVLAKMLAKRPEDRFQTAEDLVAALDAMCDPWRGGSESPRRHRRALVIATGVMFALALVFATVVYKIQRDNQEIVIATDDPDIEVVMKRKGEVLRVVDRKSGQTWEIDTVRNEIGLADTPAGLKLSLPESEAVILKREGREAFRITRVAKPANSGWVPLFNGKDLTGWKPPAKGWKVEDGLLVGRGDAQLISDRENYENFHLRFVAKTNDKAISGVMFRTGYEARSMGLSQNSLTLAGTGTEWVTFKRSYLEPLKDSLTPETWFECELIADGRNTTLKLNGKTFAQASEMTVPRGFISLVSRSTTVVHYKSIEIKELPPTLAAPASVAQPFVVLATAAKLDQKYPTLGAAITSAQAGDIIEINGNGPFVTAPLVVEKKALTIRAGTGFRPVIQLTPEHEKANAYLLRTDAAVVLEGLELRFLNEGNAFKPGPALIHTYRAPFRAANCRFLVVRQTPSTSCIVSEDSPAVELLNCELLQLGPHFAIMWNYPQGGRFRMENCLHLGRAPLRAHHRENRQASFQFLRNTSTGAGPFFEIVLIDPTDFSRREKPVDVKASQNAVESDWLVVFVQNSLFPNEKQYRTANEFRDLLPRLVRWRDNNNLYFPKHGTLSYYHPGLPVTTALADLQISKALADWERFWGLVDTKSQFAEALRFVGDKRATDLRAKLADGSDRLAPADFRLAPGAQDAGADVELLGPGAAYERWKKTPTYQEWQKLTANIAKSDKELILGIWRGVEVEMNGQKMPQTILDMMKPTLTITADKVTSKADGDGAKDFLGIAVKSGLLTPEAAAIAEKGGEGIYHIDPAKSPKTIDIVTLGGARKTALGLYSLEGDTLKLCLSIDPEKVAERPKEFATKAGEMRVIVTLKRQAVSPVPKP